jgi:polysaccharide pyruvyl transferase WcaK-like protein
MRILVDQSGYDLLNLGDVAMLQSCVARLRAQWPAAEVMVIARDPRRLEFYCPGTLAIRTVADSPLIRHFPRWSRLVYEQAWRLAAPYFSGRVGRGSRGSRRPGGRSQTMIQAVHSADLVVAGGGAYITDTWWWHAAGVLSLLSLAQRLGKSTAMFGQGIGPIRLRALRAQARAVLPGLTILGLREDQLGRSLALAFGVSPADIAVTGDDALESIGDSLADGSALGLSVRVSGYAGVDMGTAVAVGDLMLEMAAAFNTPIVALPVSRDAADAAVLSRLLRRKDRPAGPGIEDFSSPQELGAAAACCRVIVTGSYHAAVFGLAQGVPAVCLTKSSYYDAKFRGLQALFPGACFVVSLDAPDFPAHLRATVGQAWRLPASARSTARDTAGRLRDAGREAYAQFRITAEKNPARVSADGQKGLVT